MQLYFCIDTKTSLKDNSARIEMSLRDNDCLKLHSESNHQIECGSLLHKVGVA